jgi:diacylglycerol kinase (ATP)
MNNNTRFTLAARAKSFWYAFAGIRIVVVSQHNAWIHTAATAAVLTAGFCFALSAAEWCWIVAAITGVWTIEALNTSIEFLTDLVSPEHHPLAGKAKDAAAGAVLLTAAGAIIIGALVLGPHLLELIKSQSRAR